MRFINTILFVVAICITSQSTFSATGNESALPVDISLTKALSFSMPAEDKLRLAFEVDPPENSRIHPVAPKSQEIPDDALTIAGCGYYLV